MGCFIHIKDGVKAIALFALGISVPGITNSLQRNLVAKIKTKIVFFTFFLRMSAKDLFSSQNTEKN